MTVQRETEYRLTELYNMRDKAGNWLPSHLQDELEYLKRVLLMARKEALLEQIQNNLNESE